MPKINWKIHLKTIGLITGIAGIVFALNIAFSIAPEVVAAVLLIVVMGVSSYTLCYNIVGMWEIHRGKNDR